MIRPPRSQAGGVTILVALMMLVLLTLAAIGMSKNSFREIVISGTARQGTLSRNMADSGIEWAYFWIANSASPTTDTAKAITTLQTTLLKDPTLAGQAWDPLHIPSSNTSTPYTPGGALQADCKVTLPASTNVTQQGFTVGLTLMGKLPIADTSQGVGQGAFRPSSGELNVQAPDLWAVRSDAQVVVAGTTFINSKEAWISTPVK